MVPPVHEWRVPAGVAELELAGEPPSLTPVADSTLVHPRTLVLVRYAGAPVGLLEAGGPHPYAAEVASAVRRELAAELAAVKGRQEAAAPPPVTFSATVVVASRDRPEDLRRSLRSLRLLDHPRYEVLVVDSASRTDATRAAVAEVAAVGATFRYVREDVPGLSRARNRGLAEATGDVVAFTDDDVVVDRRWLAELATEFADADVACVTGLSLPAQLESPAQLWFEEFGGFGKGFERRVFDRASHRDVEPLYPYRLGWFGSGLNMAFRTSALRDLGGFDEHLGAGSRTHGGEDLDAFLRVILAGGRIVYQPRAIVWHYHRRELDALRRQVYGSGVGLSAIGVKLLADRRARRDLARRLPRAARYLLAPSSPKNARRSRAYPRRLVLAELHGVAAGPFLYAYSRLRDRRRRLAPRSGHQEA